MYSLKVSLVLLLMIITGAGRSVAVKLFYQLGFKNPLFVTLLYLCGQGLSLVVYYFSRKHSNNPTTTTACAPSTEYCTLPSENNEMADENGFLQDSCDVVHESVSKADGDAKITFLHHRPKETTVIELTIAKNATEGENARSYDALESTTTIDETESIVSSSTTSLDVATTEDKSKMESHRIALDKLGTRGDRAHSGGMFLDSECEEGQVIVPIPRPPLTRRGSKTGLTTESQKAVMWVHSIPWYLKPAIPGFFNLCNSAMRWGSLMYITASVAEMLISGLELVLSVIAARIVRKRLISNTRWKGVLIVTAGLLWVRLADVIGNNMDEKSSDDDTIMGDTSNQSNDDAPSSEIATHDDRLISTVLIIGQCIMSVCQDMAEELFMQEAEFPATLLLGMEGVFGLFFGIPLYFLFAPYFGEAPSETWNVLKSSSFKAEYVVALTCGFTLTGIFNIMATGVTSSMTRNVWKNFRTLLVWVFGLLIFYLTGNDDLGEAWIIPNSFYVLLGFVVMLSGIWVYYGDQSITCVFPTTCPWNRPLEINSSGSDTTALRSCIAEVYSDDTKSPTRPTGSSSSSSASPLPRVNTVSMP